jgi:chemotaxis protein MotB
MQRIRDALTEIPGTVSIEGHTDNMPTRGGRYESNWALSASRALSVTHELLRGGLLDDERMMVVGFADTKPFTFNDSADGRALNRRVEIVIRQGIDEGEAQDLELLRQIDPEAWKYWGLSKAWMKLRPWTESRSAALLPHQRCGDAAL